MLRRKTSNFLICLMLVLYSGLTVLSAFLMTYSTDALIKLDFSTFSFWLGIIVVIRIFLTWLDYFESVYQEKIIQRMVTDIRIDIVKKIGGMSYVEYEGTKSESYSSWLTNDMKRLQDEGFTAIFHAVDLGAQIIFATIALLYYSLLVMIAALLTTVMMIYVPRKLSANVSIKSRDLSDQYEKFLSKSNSIIGGFSIFYAFDRLPTMVKMIRQSSVETEDAAVNLQREKEKVFAAVNLVGFFGQIVIDLLTGFLAVAGVVTVGSISSTGNLSGKLTFSLSNITNDFVEIKSSRVLLQKFDLAQDIENESLVLAEVNSPIDMKQIEIKNLALSFREEIIFRDFNLTIQHGDKIIITGRSGGGKSAFAKILAGYYQNYTGEVLVDGAELKTISEKDYRKSVLYVEQTPYLFSADLQNNITLFEDPQEPELNQLLDLLELKNLNHDLTKLSGGQKQRVHLARALYQGQQVLILDEATSSLNSELQYKIEKELFSQEDLTIVIITHHLDARIAELADEVVNF